MTDPKQEQTQGQQQQQQQNVAGEPGPELHSINEPPGGLPKGIENEDAPDKAPETEPPEETRGAEDDEHEHEDAHRDDDGPARPHRNAPTHRRR